MILLELLRSCVKTDSDGIKSLSTLKDKTCVRYALLRETSLPDLWKEFLSQIGCPHIIEEPLLMELVNESLFEGIVRETFASSGTYGSMG